jgi:hypothetical protein
VLLAEGGEDIEGVEEVAKHTKDAKHGKNLKGNGKVLAALPDLRPASSPLRCFVSSFAFGGDLL